MLSQLTHCTQNLWARLSAAAHQFLRHFLQPARPNLLTGTLADLPRSRAELLAENALLRQQLIVLHRTTKTPRLTGPEQWSLVVLAHWVPNWKQVLQDHPAGHPSALAPRGFSAVLEAKIAQANPNPASTLGPGHDCLDRAAGA